jgi:hypothetical protein
VPSICTNDGLGTFLRQRHFAALFGLAREDFLQEIAEGALVALGDEQTEAPVHQPGALDAEQARAGQVHLPDRPLAVEGQVARRGKVVEVGVLGQERSARARACWSSSFCISSSIWWTCSSWTSRAVSSAVPGSPASDLLTLPLFAQPLFGAAAQLGVVRGRVRVLFHGAVSCVVSGPRLLRRDFLRRRVQGGWSEDLRLLKFRIELVEALGTKPW